MEGLPVNELRRRFGALDVYLFDQLLRGRIRPGMRVIDVGCGGGRNLVYLLAEGYEVYGLDPDAEALSAARRQAEALAGPEAAGRFHQEAMEESSFPDALADVVVANAVLHFARDPAHFHAMLAGAWRLLAPGGLWFSRLASSIGIEEAVEPLGDGADRRYALPDGSTRFLVDAQFLTAAEESLGARRLDPLKTTVVDGLRSMTTWVLRKPAD